MGAHRKANVEIRNGTLPVLCETQKKSKSEISEKIEANYAGLIPICDKIN